MFLLNKTPLNILLKLTSNKHVFSVKLDFFTSFFKNFLTWNYLLNNNPSSSGRTSNLTINTPSKTLNKYSKTNYLSVNNFIYNTSLELLNIFKKLFIYEFLLKIKIITYKSFSFSWYYITGFTFVLFIDACLTDDEPLWEPIEWSLVQTWILFIFSFAWIAENLIVSRYGSYAGRDKRVWMAWYKTFWLIEGYYVINYGVAVILVMVPFYFELNYNLSFVYSWWTWFSKVFFYKFTLLYSVILLIALWLQINVRWIGFKKALILIALINIILAYIIYTQFIFQV